MAEICDTNDKLNIGFADCKKFPEAVKSCIWTPSDFTCTVAEAVDPDFWNAQQLIGKASRIYVYPETVDTEDTTSEVSIEEKSSGAEFKSKNHVYRKRLNFAENLEVFKNLYSHDDAGGRLFEIDTDTKLIGSYTDATKTEIRGFKLNSIINEGAMGRAYDTKASFWVRYSLTDNKELDVFGAMFDFTEVYNQLFRLTSANITVLASPVPTATGFTVDIKSANHGAFGVLGLDAGGADMTIGTGTISSATADVDNSGRYVIVGVGMAGDFDLVSASALTVPGWESTGAVPTI